jgi:hypothetical protein
VIANVQTTPAFASRYATGRVDEHHELSSVNGRLRMSRDSRAGYDEPKNGDGEYGEGAGGLKGLKSMMVVGATIIDPERVFSPAITEAHVGALVAQVLRQNEVALHSPGAGAWDDVGLVMVSIFITSDDYSLSLRVSRFGGACLIPGLRVQEEGLDDVWEREEHGVIPSRSFTGERHLRSRLLFQLLLQSGISALLSLCRTTFHPPEPTSRRSASIRSRSCPMAFLLVLVVAWTARPSGEGACSCKSPHDAACALWLRERTKV